MYSQKIMYKSEVLLWASEPPINNNYRSIFYLQFSCTACMSCVKPIINDRYYIIVVQYVVNNNVDMMMSLLHVRVLHM